MAGNESTQKDEAALRQAIEANRSNVDTWIDSEGNVRTYEGPFERAPTWSIPTATSNPNQRQGWPGVRASGQPPNLRSACYHRARRPEPTPLERV